jgi:CRISPR-associated exonuclease Cas4
MSPESDLVAASALGRVVYCPRQLYYARTDDDGHEPPAEVKERQQLAFRYPELRAADHARLRSLPLAVEPAEYKTALDQLATRPVWDALVEPADREVHLTGKDCRGVAHKLLDGNAFRVGADRDVLVGDADHEAPVPVFVSGGVPPPQGVWEPQAVRAVALAKALAWEREREVPRALVEYPAVGAVRQVRLTTRRAARYREALGTVRSLDGPPPRLTDSEKCDACAYQEQCGVRSRSLRSLLGW